MSYVVCKHDQLKRQCQICDLEEELEEANNEIKRLKLENVRLSATIINQQAIIDDEESRPRFRMDANGNLTRWEA